MKKRIIITTLLASLSAFAQDGHRGPGRGEFGAFGFGHGGKTVTGAPYSADVTTQFTKKLADGNTIVRSTAAQVARDSQGRTWKQTTFTGGPWAAQQSAPVTVISIYDPVAGYMYELRPDKKIAERRAIKVRPERSLTEPSAEASTARPTRPDLAETALGVQMVQGVAAEGKTTTRTVPAGKVGNAQPLVSTNETWYAKDLQVVVLSKHTDPENGQSVYSLTNIHKAEPNAALFQIPSDYTVQDAGTGGGRHPFIR